MSGGSSASAHPRQPGSPKRIRRIANVLVLSLLLSAPLPALAWRTVFHFHAPGEHQINGVAADMELQLEHRDRQGRIAILAVPMKVGRRMNSILSRIWNHMPGMQGRRFYGRQTGINPRFLLPSDHSYFSYVGSLAEPPCTEGVEWFVLANPAEIDRSYVQRFLRAVGPKARPVQPLNGREVLASFRR